MIGERQTSPTESFSVVLKMISRAACNVWMVSLKPLKQMYNEVFPMKFEVRNTHTHIHISAASAADLVLGLSLSNKRW